MSKQNKKRPYGDAWKKDVEVSAVEVKQMDAIFDRFFAAGSRPAEPPQVVAEVIDPPIQHQPAPPVDLDLPKQDQPDQISDQLSLPNSGSLPIEAEAASQFGSLPDPGSLPNSGRLNKNLWNAIGDIKGHLILPHKFTDGLAPLLEPAELAVYLHLYRLSWGYGKDHCTIGLPRLAERARVSRGSVQTILKKLIDKGLVEKVDWIIGNKKDQGTIYRLPIPGSLPSDGRLPICGRLPSSGTNKEDSKKKADKKKLNALITHFSRINVGKHYPISELAEDVKRACAREGLLFDHELFNELIG